jgi:hypothetical protein
MRSSLPGQQTMKGADVAASLIARRAGRNEWPPLIVLPGVDAREDDGSQAFGANRSCVPADDAVARRA